MRDFASQKTPAWGAFDLARCHAVWMLAAVILSSLALLSAAPNPFEEKISPLQIGDQMPSNVFVDQSGKPFRFGMLHGRTVLLGFIYTRCTDACPIITQKFARVKSELAASGGAYHFVEASIDPAHDSLPAIRAYAKKYGAQPSSWSMVTGSADNLTTLWRSAGVSVIDSGKGDLIHNDRLVIIGPDSSVADIIDAVAWSPDEVAADMRHTAGQSASLLARSDLALTRVVAQICGGSYRTASGVVDVLMAFIVLSVFGGVFWLLGRRLFAPGA